jgi:hypothetical protein
VGLCPVPVGLWPVWRGPGGPWPLALTCPVSPLPCRPVAAPLSGIGKLRAPSGPAETPRLSGPLRSLEFSGGCVAPLAPGTRDWRATAGRALGGEIASPLVLEQDLSCHDMWAGLGAAETTRGRRLVLNIQGCPGNASPKPKSGHLAGARVSCTSPGSVVAARPGLVWFVLRDRRARVRVQCAVCSYNILIRPFLEGWGPLESGRGRFYYN